MLFMRLGDKPHSKCLIRFIVEPEAYYFISDFAIFIFFSCDIMTLHSAFVFIFVFTYDIIFDLLVYFLGQKIQP